MFNFKLLFTAAVVAIHFSFASAFQPGSDYNASMALGLYNCTGQTPVSNVTIPNAFDTLPQINTSSTNGWEQWSLFLHGTPPLILKWNKGDPSSTVPSPSHFDILVNINGTAIQSSVIGELTYTNNNDIKQIAIGNNTLTWDPNALWYNVSVNVNDYEIQLNSLSATLDSFHPNLGFYNGLIDETGSWFGSVPLIRGQIVGSLKSPTESFSLGGLTVMRHIFSENPLPSYITKYNAGTIYGYSTTFYDTHVFWQTETTSGTVHEPAFLGRALPIPGQRGGFSSAWATYSFTDDDTLYSLNIDTGNTQINASFSGCANTNNIPYQFNITSWSLIGQYTDLGGGVTTYYNLLNGSTTAAFDGNLTTGAIGGIFEQYVAPPVTSSSA